MNSIELVKNFDKDLYSYFVKEIEKQHASVSFIPDENSTSPVCAAIMGSVLVNSTSSSSLTLGRVNDLEKLTTDRLCKIFCAPFATVKTITIEAASRVVFKALTSRGDVVMSLDLRKKEHCNSENLAFRFVNYGVEPDTQELDMNKVEAIAKANKPKLIIFSPINYSAAVDFKRLSEIAKETGALLWCDLSQTASLTATGVLDNPMKYADVVTFSAHGAMQGPHAAVILCKQELAPSIQRAETMAGHNGLLSNQLAALAARLHEMQTPNFKKYCNDVLANAKALAEGLKEGGMKIIGNKIDSHLVMIDAKNCAVSARGAQELLADLGVHVRIAKVQTNDPHVSFDAVRFSTLAATTRGLGVKDMTKLGKAIAEFLQKPDDDNSKRIYKLVVSITATLPNIDKRYLDESVQEAFTREL